MFLQERMVTGSDYKNHAKLDTVTMHANAAVGSGTITGLFPFYVALYFNSTTFWRQISNCLLHYMYLTALVTSYFADSDYILKITI